MKPSTPSETVRLNKYLALHLGISRREADTLIEDGRVSINDSIASIGSRVAAGDKVTADKKPVSNETQKIYLLINKPEGYVCSRRSQGGMATVYELLPKKYHSLKTVGRLDYASSGLLLLSNDGDFTYRMTHPKFAKNKQYEVELNQELQPLHQQMISDYGVHLEDGASKLGLERLSDSHRRSWRVIMSEGRNRQIRRTFASLGYEVTRLHRTHFGPYTLDNLAPGEFKETMQK